MIRYYYTCYFPEMRALQYEPCPETWGGRITGMSDLDDDALADLSWAGCSDYGFLTEAAAVKRGINAASMEVAKSIAGQVEMTTVRMLRDNLLAASDIAVLPDRWASYSKSQRQAWTDYRVALRDMPSSISDPFNIVWPTVPN